MISPMLRKLDHLKCVPVIASFSSQGELIPLYASINGIQLKIEYFSIQQMDGSSWIPFLCTTVDQNIQKQFRLLYNIPEHAWFFDKEFRP